MCLALGTDRKMVRPRSLEVRGDVSLSPVRPADLVEMTCPGGDIKKAVYML